MQGGEGVTEEHRHEVKSSQLHTGIGSKGAEKKLFLFSLKEHGIPFFDHRENRGNMKVGRPGDRQRTRDRVGKRLCMSVEAKLEEIELSELQYGRM